MDGNVSPLMLEWTRFIFDTLWLFAPTIFGVAFAIALVLSIPRAPGVVAALIIIGGCWSSNYSLLQEHATRYSGTLNGTTVFEAFFIASVLGVLVGILLFVMFERLEQRLSRRKDA